MLQPVSSDDLLIELWDTSLIFAATGVLTALILVVRRFFEERKAARGVVKRDYFEKILWSVLHASMSVGDIELPYLKKREAPILCDVALNLLRPLRGEEADRIVLLLEKWELGRYIEDLLANGSRGRRIRVLTLLGHFRDGSSKTILKAWMQDRDLYIQLAALRALAARAAVDVLPAILKQLS